MAPMFVTFEGLDGSGKTTQKRLLQGRLEAEGRDVIATREPGGTELGEKVRDLVLHGGHVAPWAEALLYAASRAQHVEEVIRPALERGSIVLCDRYIDSSVAYQGVARGLGLDQVLDLNLLAVGGLLPDCTFLFEIEAALIGRRLRREHDRLEREDEEFHARAGEGYRLLGERFPERIVVLDGTRPVEALAEEVYGALRVRS
jgi:dTMP kinase